MKMVKINSLIKDIKRTLQVLLKVWVYDLAGFLVTAVDLEHRLIMK
jgi:hypothetical protein